MFYDCQNLKVLVAAATIATLQNFLPVQAAASGDDDKSIRTQADRYAKVFARGDAKAISEMWTPDGSFVDEQGNEYHGRAEIEAVFRDLFDRQGGQPISISIESIRFPAPDVAIEQGSAGLLNTGEARSRYTAVHVKRDGNWLMDSVTETGFTPKSNSEYLQDLNWLVGNWAATKGKESVKLKVEWLDGKNFLSLAFDAPQDRSVPFVAREFIGWNPLRNQVSSWSFGSDGGWGHGDWSRDRGAWVIDSRAVQADGRTGHATYVLTKVDDNTFTWQSTNRWLDGARLQDTNVLRVERQKTN